MAEIQDVEMIDAGSASDPEAAPFQVLNTPELLEAILLELDLLQLFMIQRTSKVFRATIVDSPNLQRKMAMKEPLNAKKHKVTKVNDIVFNNMLRDTIFVPKLAIRNGYYEGLHAMGGYEETLHSNMSNRELHFHSDRERVFWRPAKTHYLGLDDPTASWRRLLIAESKLPHFHTVMQISSRRFSEEDTETKHFAQSHSGFVTLGEVVDAVERDYEEYLETKARANG